MLSAEGGRQFQKPAEDPSRGHVCSTLPRRWLWSAELSALHCLPAQVCNRGRRIKLRALDPISVVRDDISEGDVLRIDLPDHSSLAQNKPAKICWQKCFKTGYNCPSHAFISNCKNFHLKNPLPGLCASLLVFRE